MRSAWFAILLGAATASANAEVAYVTDSLWLGIHAASDTSDRAFDNLLSGTAVEILERRPNYARVRLGDGREGWVKAAYLVTEKPAKARAMELETELAELHAALAEAKASRALLEREVAALTDGAGSVHAMRDKVSRLEADNRAYGERLASYRMTLPLGWVLLAVALTGAAGFAGGLWWLDAAIRRRHGGFRVY